MRGIFVPPSLSAPRLLAGLLLLAAQVSAVEELPLGPRGDIAQWVSSGRLTVPASATEGRDPKTLLGLPATPGILAAMGTPAIDALPSGAPPRFFGLGEDACVSDYAFYRERLRIESVLATDLVAPQAGRRDFILWLDRGAAEVLIAGRQVRQAITRGRAVEGHPFTAELAAGANRILIRRVRIGERDTPSQAGLRCLGDAGDLRVRLPLSDDRAAQELARHRWLARLRGTADGTLVAERAPDFPVTITSAAAILPWRPTQERRSQPWPAGRAELRRAEFDPTALAVRVVAGDPETGQARALDWPYLDPIPAATETDLARHRTALRGALDRTDWALFAGLDALRRLDAGATAADPTIGALVERMVTTIANRDGTSDFQMMAVLRLLFAAGDRLSPAQNERLRQVLRETPMWSDERDLGTMTFTSENHQVMFQVCARLAATLMPDAVFHGSGRNATDQARIAGERLAEWFTVRERSGFHEFLAPAYTNETFIALLNLADYDPDPAFRQRAQKHLDTIVLLAADYGLHGLPGGPNGRCYRHEMLASHHEGRSAILSWFTPTAVFAPHSITVALAHSAYPGPAAPLTVQGPLTRSDAMGGTVVHLRRTADYLLGTCTIPSALAQEPSNPFPFGKPGESLYQHHLWEISLGGHARVFTQSPATTDECLDARPGYWVGEQSAPTLALIDGAVAALYRLKPQAMIGWTHAWWPAPAFSEERVDGHWAFARAGDGYVGLWCSQPLRRVHNVSQDTELRADGPDQAWVAWAGSRTETGTFAQFQAQCQAHGPAYAPATGTLTLDGRHRLIYGASPLPAGPTPGPQP